MLHYAWGHSSTGDMAIAPGMIALIKEIIPTATISLLTLHGNERYVETERYLQSLFPDVHVYPDFFASLMPEKEPNQRWWRFMTLGLDPEDALARVADVHVRGVRAWRDADLRLYTPSMQLTYHPKGGTQGLRFWLPVVFAQRMGLPYALYGQSFGDIDPPGMEMFARFLQDSLMVTARDSTSLAVLNQAGVVRPQTGFTPDTSLYFEHRDDDWAEAFLTDHGLDPGGYLLVLPRTYGFWGVVPSEETLNLRMSKLAQTIEAWVRATGRKALIGYELPREKERTVSYLWPLLSDDVKAKCVRFDGEWTAEAALSVYAQSRTILTMERYAVFFALTAGVPVLHPTTAELGLRLEALNIADVADWHIDIDQVPTEELSARLIHLDADHERQSARSAEAARRLRTMGHTEMRRLAERIAPSAALKEA